MPNVTSTPNLEFETLAEVADIDNLLGFKGNYMMFPRRSRTPLTEFMTVPYFDFAIPRPAAPRR